MTKWWSAVLAVAMLAVACGDAGEPGTSATTAPPPTSTLPPPTTAPPATSAPTTVPSTTTTAAPTTTSAPTTTTTIAPTTTASGPAGQPYDLFVPVPAEGAVLGVVGVPYDDVLNVRSGPGVEFEIVGTLAPTAEGISGTGDGWQLPSGAVWWRVDAGAFGGWAASRFLARLDGTFDATAGVVGSLGELPAAETMVDLGELVAGTFVDADVGSEVVQITTPSVGDLGEITYDVLGFADDSVGGVRLHIFATPGDESFTLKSVEATSFCTRGVADDICV